VYVYVSVYVFMCTCASVCVCMRVCVCVCVFVYMTLSLSLCVAQYLVELQRLLVADAGKNTQKSARYYIFQTKSLYRVA